jgi:hypothetical protein
MTTYIKPLVINAVLARCKQAVARGIDWQIDSTGGRPNDREKAALEAKLNQWDGQGLDDVVVEDALQGFHEDELDTLTTDELTVSVLGTVAGQWAESQLADEWGGDVGDGAAYIATLPY